MAAFKPSLAFAAQCTRSLSHALKNMGTSDFTLNRFFKSNEVVVIQRKLELGPLPPLLMGEEFSTAFIKLKTREWNSYASHFSAWENENTLDI